MKRFLVKYMAGADWSIAADEFRIEGSWLVFFYGEIRIAAIPADSVRRIHEERK